MQPKLLALPESNPVRQVPVPGWTNTFYDWHPGERLLTFHRYGVCLGPFKMRDGVTGVFIRQGPECTLDWEPATPPKDDLRRPAWFFGFYGSLKAATIAEAQAAVASIERDEPLVVAGRGYVFVYAVRSIGNVRMYRPHRWAIERTANPLEMWEVLYNIAKSATSE